MPEDLSRVDMGLLFSTGVSLQTWANVGILEREMGLYGPLATRLRQLSFITYGGVRDRSRAAAVPGIRLLPTYATRSRWLNYRILRALHGRELDGFDLVKSNQIPGADVGVRLKRSSGCRLVTRCGYLASFFAEMGQVADAEMRRTLSLEEEAFEAADVGVVTTEKARQRVLSQYRLDPDKIRVVPNYVDTERFCPGTKGPPDGTASLIYVGRLAPQKNLPALLDALVLVRDRLGKAPRLTMIGDGPQRGDLEAQVRQTGLPVEFRGNVPSGQLPAEFQRCQVFVLPSLYEGHPKALLEAMACGLACIGTAVEGIAEELRHDETGLLCETHAEGLAQAIARLLPDPDLRRDLGCAARRHIEANYALSRIVELETQVLLDALA